MSADSLRRISFPDVFFQEEVRDGFFIEHKMKCAWAAQMEVLMEIDRICGKYGIRYFADSGTLLGAVRHKGFIPWDDDIDIAMLRDDYQRFFGIVRQELPEGWVTLEMDDEYNELFGRVANSRIYDSGKERLLRFHGCPYAVGVDVFPIDYVPPIKEEEEIWYLISKYLFELARNIRIFGEANILEKIEPDLQVMEEMCRVKFERNGTLEMQIKKLLNNMIQMYSSNGGGKELEYIVYDLKSAGQRYIYKLEWYAETIQAPFENIMIPIPAGYAEILRVLYGDDYMTPMRENTHDYPFYKKQDIQLEEMRKKIWTSDKEGRV